MHIKKIRSLLFFLLFITSPAFATSADNATLIGGGAADVTTPVNTTDFIPADVLLYSEPNDTECATKIFANALAKSATNISETDPEQVIQQWIYETFADANVLRAVLACPEFANLADDDTIKLMPIKYTFPSGREITINYETQPKILKQRIMLAQQRDLPPGPPNPSIGPNDDAIWTNTDPAWYGIMVVEAGSLDDFIGPDKNNTISLKYIEDNIDSIFPRGAQCTSKSALAGNKEIINVAMHETVNLEDDTNDYYVAGDADLRWIAYLEIGFDVVLTVATWGVGTAILGTTKAARASRALKNMGSALEKLQKSESVRDYLRLVQKHRKALEELAELEKIDDAADAATAAAKAQKLEEIAEYQKTLRNMENTNQDVSRYQEITKTYRELHRYSRAFNLRHLRQRGNIIARTWRAVRAASSGAKKLRKAEKIAHSSTFSGRIRDWLFQSTMRNIGALGRMQRATSVIYGTLMTIGGFFYDLTETSTGDYTNNIQFKPLALLSADDLQGQENEVNFGMWLMWAGDAYSAADDDAAYLQAMDFANKFHYNLEAVQEEKNNHACNVDIYVVRPIIRNPGTDNAELYYLVMNDEPWTTRDTTNE